MSTYNIIKILLLLFLAIVIFASIKFNINKIRRSYLKNDYFSISFIIFSHAPTFSINSQYSI